MVDTQTSPPHPSPPPPHIAQHITLIELMMWYKSCVPFDPITAPPSRPQSSYDWTTPGDGCRPRTLALSYDSLPPSLRVEPALVFHLQTVTFPSSSPRRGQAGPQSEALSVRMVEWGWRQQVVILSLVQLKSGKASFKAVSGFVLRESSGRKPGSFFSFSFCPSRRRDVLRR